MEEEMLKRAVSKIYFFHHIKHTLATNQLASIRTDMPIYSRFKYPRSNMRT
jgi:hypothetical protein